MYSAPVLAPVSHLVRPERSVPMPGFLERNAHLCVGLIQRPRRSRQGPYRQFVARVNALDDEMSALDDAGLDERADALRLALPREHFADGCVVEAFALVREVSHRVLGLRHFDSQVFGGYVLLEGCVAEMATGEGKTLTATLPACVAALAGIPVHVVSVNDYLTARDAETMRPLYERLGLTVGIVVHGMEPAERRIAYGASITYCTNKELVFDYLKDRIKLEDRTHHLRLQADSLGGADSRSGELLLRGLHYAVVDEIDSILIDEGRTPLILSRSTPGNADEERVYAEALTLGRALELGDDYTHDVERRHIDLTDEGRLTVEELTADLGSLWTGRIRREELARQALSALHLFERDRHYLVRDGKVQIIDEYTGRVMADRSWEGGLHQLIELKEELEITAPKETLARISYQRFFRQYQHFSGMTGTAQEIRGEMWAVYGLPVVPVPLNRPCIRVRLPDRVCVDEAAKWRLVAERAAALRASGRAVLVGTRTVEASEHLSAALDAAGVEHHVLNAKQDEEEAEIVARAGEAGQVTVATNMAGRGTDIKLSPQVESAGGLHVILTERHESGRIDRQLEGRGARQGDPGSYEVIVSLEDFLVNGKRGGWAARVARSSVAHGLGMSSSLALYALDRSQHRLERIHAKFRKAVVKADDRQSETLAFAGR